MEACLPEKWDRVPNDIASHDHSTTFCKIDNFSAFVFLAGMFGSYFVSGFCK